VLYSSKLLQHEESHIRLGDSFKLDAMGQESSAVCAATGCAELLDVSELKRLAGLQLFSSARSKLIANRMLPRPTVNGSTNNYSQNKQ